MKPELVYRSTYLSFAGQKTWSNLNNRTMKKVRVMTMAATTYRRGDVIAEGELPRTPFRSLLISFFNLCMLLH